VFRTIEIKELDGTGSGVPPKGGPKRKDVPEAEDWSRVAWAVTGQWQTEFDQLVQTNPDCHGFVFFGDSTWSDYTISVDVNLVQGRTDVGLFFRLARGQLWDNYLYPVGTPAFRSSSIARSFRGTLETLSGQPGHATLTPGRWHTMMVDARGTRFTAFLDGRVVGTCSDSAMSMGCVGLRTWNSICRFRNIRVTAPDGKLLWEGLPELRTSRSIGVPLKSHE
jgi:eukaryotic-like serine/threonine-protein kinase